MKKLFIILSLIFYFLSFHLSLAEQDENSCEIKTGYDLYECRVKNICEPYKPSKVIYETKENDYEKATNADELSTAKEKYRKNMNNIYKCSLLKTQKKSLTTLKYKLLKADKSGSIAEKIEGKIDLRIQKIDIVLKKIKCIEYKDEQINDKLTVLKQTTYEICKYTNYLEYIKEYNSDLSNLLGKNKKENEKTKQYYIGYVADLKAKKQKEVNDEIEHSFKIFPIAYHAYSEYENNFTIHILLELIREDFIVFRNKLHSVLGPISQVVYKIANAMSF